MYVYAQLNDKGICFSVSYLSGDISGDKVIKLDEKIPNGYSTHAEFYCGRMYRNGGWEVVEDLDVVEG